MKLYPNKEDQCLYVGTLGKMVKVTAILTTVQSVNDYLETNPEDGLIYQTGTLYFCAKNSDTGLKVEWKQDT